MFFNFFQFVFKKIAQALKVGKKRELQEGFTMIELLVVMAIFTVVIGISADIFTSSFAAQRQARKLQDILDNARYALERIAKTARVSCVLNSSAVSSTSSLKLYHFRRKKKLIYEVENDKLMEKELGAGGVEASLIGENVDIERLRFRLRGVGTSNNQQTRITIFLGLSPKLPKYEDQIIDLQTTISPRFLEKYFPADSGFVCN